MRSVHISEKEWLGVYGQCRDCQSTISHYTCNHDLIVKRPDAATWDWWSACDNPDCPHHEGEGIFQFRPKWEIPKDKITTQGDHPNDSNG